MGMGFNTEEQLEDQYILKYSWSVEKEEWGLRLELNQTFADLFGLDKT